MCLEVRSSRCLQVLPSKICVIFALEAAQEHQRDSRANNAEAATGKHVGRCDLPVSQDEACIPGQFQKFSRRIGAAVCV
jgi:hypothetical protein